MADMNEILGWDAVITEDEAQFITLPEGDYPFTVTSAARKTYEKKREESKLPDGCPYLEIIMRFDAPNGDSTTVTDNLYLCSTMQFKVGGFLLGVGLKQKGQPVNVGAVFQQIMGRKGVAHLTVNKYIDKSGNEQTNNRVKYYLDPTKNTQPTTAPTAAPAAPTTSAPWDRQTQERKPWGGQ